MIPEILTSTGSFFNFLEPELSEIDIRFVAYALSNTCRFNGHCYPFYSVAEHSVRVSRLVPERDAFEALMHDAPESVIGDIPTPLKHLLPDYKKIEYGVEVAFAKKFGYRFPFPPSVKIADTVMLATEQRDLMPQHSLKDYGVDPVSERIKPWTALEAEAAFLAVFCQLAAVREFA